MINRLFAAGRVLFLICFLAMVFYLTYELGKLCGESGVLASGEEQMATLIKYQNFGCDNSLL